MNCFILIINLIFNIYKYSLSFMRFFNYFGFLIFISFFFYININSFLFYYIYIKFCFIYVYFKLENFLLKISNHYVYNFGIKNHNLLIYLIILYILKLLLNINKLFRKILSYINLNYVLIINHFIFNIKWY